VARWLGATLTTQHKTCTLHNIQQDRDAPDIQNISLITEHIGLLLKNNTELVQWECPHSSTIRSLRADQGTRTSGGDDSWRFKTTIWIPIIDLLEMAIKTLLS
jgi:hypothetical protein